MKLHPLLVCFALLAAGCPGTDGDSDTPPTDGDTDGAGDKNGDDTPVAPPKPFDMSTARTPWKYAKVGDWALYRMHSGNLDLRFEVTKLNDVAVTFTVTNTKTGEQTNEATDLFEDLEAKYKDPFTYDAYAKDKDGKEIKPYTEKVTVKGKEIEALVIKRAGLGSTTELWIAEKHVRPFVQCSVKSFKNGKLEIELLDFGPFEGGGAAEKAPLDPKSAPCKICGEPRGDASPCPHCGMQ